MSDNQVLEVDKTLSPLENDWLSALPAKYRRAAFLCYKEMRVTIKFNNSIERNKVSLAYMDAFVTAIHLAHNPKEGSDNEESKSNEESSEEVQQQSSEPQADSDKIREAFDDNQRSP